MNEILRALEASERAEVDSFSGEVLRGFGLVVELDPLAIATEPLRCTLGVAGDSLLALVALDASSLVLAILLSEPEATGSGLTGGRCTGVDVRELLLGSALAKYDMIEDWRPAFEEEEEEGGRELCIAGRGSVVKSDLKTYSDLGSPSACHLGSVQSRLIHGALSALHPGFDSAGPLFFGDG